ncbi:carbohydrate ABC transporter permease [Streptomyces qinglanensis]|uniref:Raffinose/stachyose/melibiose transport system permease protein n=1 Tax=Streptomyces qinglanensis TaxID=943816 RepID=A0A1H9TH15_9ACTN|nr:carbohydrate ABC transporter permease [Streptomyces qinglanensis]SER96327.1 raffinose/stachyose/melibiose transport system permease protein [Streptomyces qinglanensis]
MNTSRTERGVTYGILALFALIALTPVAGILSTALARQDSLKTGFALPDGLNWHNFADAWTRGHFGSYLFNSVLVAVAVVAATTVLATLAAYAFGTMRFPGSEVLFYLFVVGLTLPQEAVIVPLYFDLRHWGLTDTYWGLILPQTAQSLAFGVFWMRTYFRNTPRSLLEAARIDGATHWSTLTRILVPMGRPAFSTLTVIVFMWTWNEFLMALVMVSDEAHRTVPLGLAFFQGQHSSDTALLAAAATLIALPVVAVYLLLQRRFIQGMLTGSAKE